MNQLERIANFESQLNAAKPHTRRGFIDSFYAGLVQGEIYGMTPEAIEAASQSIAKYDGFQPHAKKLLNHPAYEENKKSMAALYGLETHPRLGGHYSAAIDGPMLAQGLRRGLFSQERVYGAINLFEDAEIKDRLETIERLPQESTTYMPTVDDPLLDLGVRKGLFRQERVDEAIAGYEAVHGRRMDMYRVFEEQLRSEGGRFNSQLTDLLLASEDIHGGIHIASVPRLAGDRLTLRQLQEREFGGFNFMHILQLGDSPLKPALPEKYDYQPRTGN